MTDLGAIREALSVAEAERGALAAGLVESTAELEAERRRLAALEAGGETEEATAAAARIRELIERRRESASAIAELNERVRVELEELLDPELELEGGVPLVLLPVRIEVRSTEDQSALRVRIFHDAVHAETLDEGLDDRERDAGVRYWDEVWQSGDPEGPWPALVAAAGAGRAPWVAEALRPTNLEARPGAAPEYPETPPRGARQAVARTLPDRFYVRVEQDGAEPHTEPGNAIADELPIGLSGRDELSALEIGDRDLPQVDESLRWLVDYGEAERVGMAVTVPLPLPGEDVRRVVVYGVRAALAPDAGAARLEHLVRSHRFTDGAEFVAQGTPTNNTDSVRTEWSRRTPAGPPALAAAAELAEGANAAVTAAALGLDAGLLATLPGARDAEQARAAAFNTALWTTTWGDAIEHLTPGGRADGDKRLDNPSLDAVRDHWVEHVRGRGSLPVLRLGRQPYGLLPLVATDESWEPLRGGFVEDRLVPFIDRQIRWIWDDALANVATVTNRPLDVALPEILGTDAVLRGLRVRTALSPDPMVKGAMALLLPDLDDDRSQQQVTKALLVLAGVAPEALDENDLLSIKTRTLALPLVHETDLEFVAGLLEPVPPPMQHRSVLQVLLAHAAAVERHNREAMAPPRTREILRAAVLESRVDVDRELVVQALDAVLEAEAFDDGIVIDAAQHLTERVGRFDARPIADRHPFPALAPETVVQQIAGLEPDFNRLRGELGIQFIGELFHGARWAAAFRAALETIGKVESLDERRLLLSETLDCCSHRLDAWITAAASRRLGDLRDSGADGAFIGAYGWLENVSLRTPAGAGQVDGVDVRRDPGDGGYVHAPGLTHAATAGVLRSGRLTHRRGDPNQEALDIDLSSTRMRDAASLLDGIRRGQSLGALLGYRLERRLHERSGGELELDRFIYVLRTLAPLRGGKLTDPGQPVQEALAASDVVDGLRLMEVPPAEVAQKLVDGPDDQRYIVAPDAWVPPRPGESEAVLAAIAELERTHDAVADLLLAESVHQTVSGNVARAAAVLDVLGAGEAVPPEPEVLRTPRTGVPIQHRIAILVADPAPAPVAGWNASAPRAAAEPRLEAWAQSALGDPSELEIAAGHPETIADAGLCALDLIYESDSDAVETSTLAARLRAAVGDLGDDLTPLAAVWELAGILRAVLLAGRPLDVPDLGRPPDEQAEGRLPDADDLRDRATAARDALATAAAEPEPLAALAGFGVRPPGDLGALEPEELAVSIEALVAEAGTRVEQATLLVDRATAADSPKQVVELSSQALATVFGAGFVSVPLLLPPPAAEPDPWAGAVGPAGVRTRPGAEIRPWLARAGALRPSTSAYGETVLVREARGGGPLLRAVQTPAGAYGAWVGIPFGNDKPPMAPLASMVAEIAGAAAGDPEPDLAGAVAGVVLDEWTEVLPMRLERGDPEDETEIVDVTTTGVAMNANAPGARPPQAFLVALSPDGGAWTGERLVRVLDEAAALTRMRAVTLQQLPYAGRYLPALYFRDWSLQGEPVIDWLQVATEFDPEHAIEFLAVDQ